MSTQQDDGGPAFPCMMEELQYFKDDDGGFTLPTGKYVPCKGMSLRDHAELKIIAGLCGSQDFMIRLLDKQRVDGCDTHDCLVRAGKQIADSWMKQRKGTDQ